LENNGAGEKYSMEKYDAEFIAREESPVQPPKGQKEEKKKAQ